MAFESFVWHSDEDMLVTDKWAFGKDNRLCYWAIGPSPVERAKFKDKFFLHLYLSFNFSDDDDTWYFSKWHDVFDSVEEAQEYAQSLGRPIAA